MKSTCSARVSVVIPSRNRHDLLDRAIASVHRQCGKGTDFTLEVIVVDDASDPPLRPNLKSGDQCIRLHTNGGAAHARNIGCQAATGDYIAFLDSDDVWLDTKISRQLEMLRQHAPRTADVPLVVVGCGFRKRQRKGWGFQEVVPNNVNDLGGFVSGIRFCPGSAALMPREVFETVGAFDDKLLRLEDFDWYIRFALWGGRIIIVPEVLAAIEPSGPVNLSQVTEAAETLKRKHLPQLTKARVVRPFLSFLDLVCAEAKFVNSRRIGCAYDLAKSILRYPRTRLQLLADTSFVAVPIAN